MCPSQIVPTPPNRDVQLAIFSLIQKLSLTALASCVLERCPPLLLKGFGLLGAVERALLIAVGELHY